jgi:hypothetical protein
MAPKKLTRFFALTCVITTLAGCSTAAPSTDDEAGVLADGRRPRTTTTRPPATTKPTTTTAAPATSAAPTTAAPATTAPPATTTTVPDTAQPTNALRCSQLRAAAAANPPRFAASSTFNQPSTCFGERADSDRWSSNWFRNATYPGRTDPSKRGRIAVAFDAYSMPVYYTDDATTTVRVFTTGWAYGHNLGSNNVIPWNPSWEPASGNDMEMVILDRDTGTEWNLWGVQKVNWSSCFTLDNLLAGWRAGIDLCVATAKIGKNPDGTIANATTSTGFSQTAGRGLGAVLGMTLLPTLDELEKGSINHAVNMETFGTMFGPACTPQQAMTAAAGVDCGFAVAPASRLEWFNGPASECGSVAQQNTPTDRAKTVPEGMRFAIDLTDAEIDAWLDTRGYTGAKRSTARIFAVALRDYGWVISDTTCWDSSMAVEGVANPTARVRWNALGITNPVSDGSTLLQGLITSESRVRALESPQPGLLLNSK